ncbi:MAG: DNA polymerase III subunit chi [Gemmatimonadota bacterium]
MRVDFYFNVDHRLQYACRVVRKARAANLSVLVYARDADRMARFDNALWTFSALDFVPHVYVDSPLAHGTPVWLTLTADGDTRRDLLLNLDDDVPAAGWCTGFPRVIEVVSRDDDDRARARQRFRTWRERGVVPAAHEVSGE